jgi:hypothetical protein
MNLLSAELGLSPYRSAGVVAFAPVALAAPGFVVAGFFDAVAPVALDPPGCAVAGFLDAVAPVGFTAPGFDVVTAPVLLPTGLDVRVFATVLDASLSSQSAIHIKSLNRYLYLPCPHNYSFLIFIPSIVNEFLENIHNSFFHYKSLPIDDMWCSYF